MTTRPTASTITDAQLDALYAERADAWQKFATVCAQRDRLRMRMNALADRWDSALSVDKPYARALRDEISVEPGPAEPDATPPDDLTGYATPDPPSGCLAITAAPGPAPVTECGPACTEQHVYDWTCALFAGISSPLEDEPTEFKAAASGLKTVPLTLPRDLAAALLDAPEPDLAYDLHQAQDALDFVKECCDIADREGRRPTTADVREWLKGARCGRQLAADARRAQAARRKRDSPPA